MKKLTIFTVKQTFLLALFLSASATALAQATDWKGTCAVEFRGTSTLHDFTGHAPVKSFSLTIKNPNTGENAAITADLHAKVADMDTKNEKRDKKMRESMKISAFPGIAVSIADLKVKDTKPVWHDDLPEPTEIPFTLTLLGKEQHLTGKVSQWHSKDGEVEFRVSFEVSLAKSGIDVPSVLGVIRVGDTIEIDANLKLKRKTS